MVPTQTVNAWCTNFCQWAECHELPERKIVGAFLVNLEGQAKVWYDALSVEQKSNTSPTPGAQEKPALPRS
jgi:hypothetical protein